MAVMTETNASIATHNGIFTVISDATGEHRTFRIHTQKQDADFAPGERILSMLIGPNNEGDYKGLGFVDKFGDVRLWRSQDTDFNRKIAAIIRHPERFPVSYTFSTVCRRCNRTLTTPESVESGIGPDCKKYEQGLK